MIQVWIQDTGTWSVQTVNQLVLAWQWWDQNSNGQDQDTRSQDSDIEVQDPDRWDIDLRLPVAGLRSIIPLNLVQIYC